MMSQHDLMRRGAAVFTCAALGVLSACSGSEGDAESRAAPPTRETSQPNRPAAAPAVALRIADGVEFPDDRQPSDAALGQAIADLAGALASGDADAMASLLDPAGATVLEDLEARGAWEQSTARIERVRVTLVEPSTGTARVALGVLDDSGAYLLGWEALQIDGSWQFGGLAIDPRTALTLAELDGAALTVRMTPVARAEDEALPSDEAADEPAQRGRSTRSRGLAR